MGLFFSGRRTKYCAEGLREPHVHLVVHQPHRHFRDPRGPLADLDAVEGVHVDQRKRLDVQLPLPAVQRLEHLDFQQAKLAVGDDQEIAAAAGRVEESQPGQLLVELLQLVLVALDALELGPQVVEKQAANRP